MSNFRETTQKHLHTFFNDNPDLQFLNDNIIRAIEIILFAVKNGKKVLICGNGGSASDSEHIAGELLKGFLLKRPLNDRLKRSLAEKFGADGEKIAENLQQGIKCIPLVSFCALNTAYMNDCAPDLLFAQQINALADDGDVLIALSTSGNSSNVVYGAEIAALLGVKVISFTGRTGGKLKNLSDVLLNAPSDVTYRIQEYHLPIYHILCAAVESELFDE